MTEISKFSPITDTGYRNSRITMDYDALGKK